MEQTAQTPKMLRARISDEEWARIRKEAIDRRQHTADFVADLLRAGLECLPTKETTDGRK